MITGHRKARLLRSALMTAACAAGIGLAVGPASAVVLVNAPPSNITLGKSIKSGVWYQSYSGGPRWAKISILAPNRRVVWSRRVTASAASFKYFWYRPRHTGVYTLRYKTAHGASSLHIKVRP